MRREGRRPVAAMDKMSGMRRKGTPAWMYAYRDVGGRPRLEQAVEVVEPRLERATEAAEWRREQAAEDVRSRPGRPESTPQNH